MRRRCIQPAGHAACRRWSAARPLTPDAYATQSRLASRGSRSASQVRTTRRIATGSQPEPLRTPNDARATLPNEFPSWKPTLSDNGSQFSAWPPALCSFHNAFATFPTVCRTLRRLLPLRIATGRSSDTLGWWWRWRTQATCLNRMFNTERDAKATMTQDFCMASGPLLNVMTLCDGSNRTGAKGDVVAWPRQRRKSD